MPSNHYELAGFQEMSPEEQQAERHRHWEIGRQIILAADRVYIDVDNEFDGITGHGSLLSIGAKSPDGATFYRELQPSSDLFIPANKRFCDMHGLERERLMDEGEDPRKAMNDFNEWTMDNVHLHNKSPIFTGLNVSQDWAHVDLAFYKAGIRNPYGVEAFDIQSLMLPLARSWNWKNTSIDSLPSHIVPTESFSHNALEDAQYQQKLHYGMAALLGSTDYHPN